jgi:flagellar hook assembly protein FlgD
MQKKVSSLIIAVTVFVLLQLVLLPMGTLVITISFVSPSAKALTPPIKIVPVAKKAITHSSSISVTVVVASDESKTLLPEAFSLSQNYPNPFNSQTVIKYALFEGCYVKLTVYNMLGQKVKTLVNEYQNAGFRVVDWNGRNEEGYEVASGLYLYRFETPNYSDTKKMILLR